MGFMFIPLRIFISVVTEGRPGWFVNENGEVSMQNVPAVPSEPKRRRVRDALPAAASRLG